MNYKANILVIDDEKDVRDLLDNALGKQGHYVDTASNGEEGIEKIKNQKYDLAFLDLKMPKLDGIETLQEIKRIDPNIEVIIVTGFGTLESAIFAMKKGAFDYIKKPFNLDIISGLIPKALEKRELKLEISLYKASKTLFSSLNLINLLDRIIDLILRIIQADDASIMLFDSESKLFIANSYKLNEENKRKVHLQIGDLILKRLSTEKQPLIISNGLHGYPEFAGFGEMADIKSCIICPLLTKTELIGIIVLIRSSELINYTEMDLRNISIIANQMAQALENANLYKKLEHKIEELKKAEETLEFGSTHDPLTTLPNRLLLHDRLILAISQAKRYKYYIAILLLDIDNFNEINDTMGHESGDFLLKEISERLKNCIRDYHTVARMGGDEFVMVIGDLSDEQGAKSMAERVLKTFKTPFAVKNHEIFLTACIGITIYPADGDNIEILLKNADMAMCAAKKLGRNKFSFFTPSMGKAIEERMAIKEGLQRAIVKEEFVLYYQPLNDTETKRIVGAEALIRWNHPSFGMIQPLNFITIAETTGLILPIGEWVLRTACAQGKKWQEQGHMLPVAVNLSNYQLKDKELVDKILDILDKTGFLPENLILEITESAAIDNLETTIQILKKLHERGIKIFIDDFGSEYSSFNWLKILPVQGLKIDRFFVQNIIDDPFSAAIVKTIITMAHSLNIKVVVEGVENIKQLEYLKATKWPFEEIPQCDHVQGFLFSKPVPADDFSALLEAQKNSLEPDEGDELINL